MKERDALLTMLIHHISVFSKAIEMFSLALPSEAIDSDVMIFRCCRKEEEIKISNQDMALRPA